MEILVENNAMQRLLRIAELMDNYEFRTTALSKNLLEQDGEPITDFFYVERDQLVRPAHVRGSQVNFKYLEEFRKQGARILGSAHSHGKIKVFYSNIDEEQFVLDIARFPGIQTLEYLEFSLDKLINDEESPILRGYNKTNLDVLLKDVDPEVVRKLLEVKPVARLLKKKRKEVIGITVNREGKIYGTKRVRERDFLLPSEQIVAPKESENVIKKVKSVEYTVKNVEVVIVENEPVAGINNNELIRELEERVRFSGEKPSSFKKKVFVPRKPKKKLEITKPKKKPKLVSIEEVVKTEPKIIEERVPYKIDQSYLTGIESLTPPLVRKRDLIFDWFIEKIIPKKETKMIKCDPILNFLKIYSHYSNEIRTTDYIKLHSTSCKISSLYRQLEKYDLPIEYMESIKEMTTRSRKILEEAKPEFKERLDKNYRIVISEYKEGDLKKKKELSKELREIRDGYFAIKDSKAGEINDVLQELGKEIRERK